MSRPVKIRISSLFWPGAVALVVLLQFWWLPGQPRRATDSYSHLSGGKLGLYRVLRQLFPDVVRQSDRLVPNGPATLIIVDPLENPNQKALQDLSRFVRGGGVLVFAPNRAEPAAECLPLGFTIEDFDSPAPGDSRIPIGDDDNRRDDVAESPGSGYWPVAVALTSSLVDQSVSWQTAADIRPATGFRTRVLARDDMDRIHIVAITVGDGVVVACSSSDVFGNQSLLDPSDAEMAVRIVEHAARITSRKQGADRPVIINEALNDSRVGDAWAILLGPALRTGTLQLVLTGLFIAWLGYYRFGPLRKTRGRERKTMTDSARALGNLQYRTQHGGHVVAQYLGFIQSQLRRTSGGHANLDNAALLSTRSGLPVDVIRDHLERARSMSRTGRESPAQSARMIRWLAMLHRRLTQPRGREKQANPHVDS